MIARYSLLSLFCLLMLGTACQATVPSVANTPTSVSPGPPTATPIDHSEFWEAWEAGPHANTYDLGKGPNTYCSKCHAPRNWDPQAVIDPPPNCVCCKFSFESAPRIAQGNPLVPEEQWLDIGCDVCHRIIEGNVDPRLAWWDQAAGQYILVADEKSLCSRCHADTETIRHDRDLGNSVHADFQCADCHDPHSLATSCTESGCHATISANNNHDGPVPTPADDMHPDGAAGVCGSTDCHAQATAVARAESSMHDPAHAAVACVACHDASGLEVGPMEETGLWMTFRTTVLLGRSTTKPYQSHAIALEVDCSRCHFEDNAWGLLPIE